MSSYIYTIYDYDLNKLESPLLGDALIQTALIQTALPASTQVAVFFHAGVI